MTCITLCLSTETPKFSFSEALNTSIRKFRPLLSMKELQSSLLAYFSCKSYSLVNMSYSLVYMLLTELLGSINRSYKSIRL